MPDSRPFKYREAFTLGSAECCKPSKFGEQVECRVHDKIFCRTLDLEVTPGWRLFVLVICDLGPPALTERSLVGLLSARRSAAAGLVLAAARSVLPPEMTEPKRRGALPRGLRHRGGASSSFHDEKVAS